MSGLTTDKFLSKHEVEQLTTAVHEKAAADREDGRKTWPRIEMMIRLGLGSGLRCSELIELRVGDLDLGHEPTIFVRKGKGDKEREVPISGELKNRLRRWIRKYGLSDEDYVLTRRYSRMGLHDQFKKALEAAGLPDRYSLHSMRHTYGTYLYERERDLRLVQRMMGHSKPQVTQIYVGVTKEAAFRQVNGLYQ